MSKRAEIAQLTEKLERLEKETAQLLTLKGALKDSREAMAVFKADHFLYREYSATDDRSFWRRTVVRSYFAGIEGLCYLDKRVALATAAVNKIDLTSAELAVLREEDYGLNDKGEAECRKSKLRTVPNIIFSFRVLARAQGGIFDLDKSSEGYQAFVKSVGVRDRITHPKNASDLEVTKEEVDRMKDAVIWFIRMSTQINSATEGTLPKSSSGIPESRRLKKQ